MVCRVEVRKPRPNCCNHMIFDSVGRSIITVSKRREIDTFVEHVHGKENIQFPLSSGDPGTLHEGRCFPRVHCGRPYAGTPKMPCHEVGMPLGYTES